MPPFPLIYPSWFPWRSHQFRQYRVLGY